MWWLRWWWMDGYIACMQWSRSPGKSGSHFHPSSDLFQPNERNDVLTSTACWVAMAALLAGLTFLMGPLLMLNLYFVPYWVRSYPLHTYVGSLMWSVDWVPLSSACPRSPLLWMWGTKPTLPSFLISLYFNSTSLQIFVMWLDFVTYLHHHGHNDKLPWYRGKVRLTNY